MLNEISLLSLCLGLFVLVCLSILIFYIFKKCKTNNNKTLKPSSNDFPMRTGKTHFVKTSYSLKIDELNKDLEPFGFAYYPKQDMFYSIMNGWQRECGYCELYDEAAPALCMIIDSEPIRFEYGGKKWLIEYWKGQYGMTTGCEIGIYTTDGPNLNIPDFFDGTFYSAAQDEDHLFLAFELRKQGKLLFSRSQIHWWLTGFKLGEFSNPSDLSMSIAITLKNPEMLEAFLSGLSEAGYSQDEYIVLGNTVRIIFEKPHSPQPVSRTSIIEYLMQTYNQRNCEAYQFATKNYYNPLDKLELVKMQAPKMYQKIINVGNMKELFSGYNIIQTFMDENK